LQANEPLQTVLQRQWLSWFANGYRFDGKGCCPLRSHSRTAEAGLKEAAGSVKLFKFGVP
jgi:hypothetical protein